jgi:carbon-monoxide dehydrogenase large subunit
MVTTKENAPEVKSSQGYFGRAMKRVEDPRLVKGIATYVDDLKLRGMLYAEFVRSPHANANIKFIKTDEAKKLPGVVGIFTGADLNDKVGTIPCASPLPGGKSPDHTVLAYGLSE